MKLMDITGRRILLLTTLPVLIVSLILLVIANLVTLSSVVEAAISTTCVIIYLCLCHGLWANPKYPLLRDLSDKGAWPLHCHLCPGVLDFRHYRHLHAASSA
ncbi:hypothetical protein ABKV19_017047 [Rosa sericea]